MRTMWEFKTKNFRVEWRIRRDTFDGRYMDKSLADECRKKIRTGEWKCFESEVVVIFKGRELSAEYLGGSIYANPADFRDHFGMNHKGHGSYFSQMVREAARNARAEFKRQKQDAIKHAAQMQQVRI